MLELQEAEIVNTNGVNDMYIFIHQCSFFDSVKNHFSSASKSS